MHFMNATLLPSPASINQVWQPHRLPQRLSSHGDDTEPCCPLLPHDGQVHLSNKQP
jgi:hypothetical protein